LPPETVERPTPSNRRPRNKSVARYTSPPHIYLTSVAAE